jgi:5-methylcytosine-specific restriction endonuclease McrA
MGKPVWAAPVFVFCFAACVSRPASTTPASVRQVMNGIIGPSSDAIFHAVATTSDENGIERKFPQTDEEWQHLEIQAMTLRESTDLLLDHRRPIAMPGERTRDPELYPEPQEIQSLVGTNQAKWDTFARDMDEAVLSSLEAIQARNPEALLMSTDRLNFTCEQCHLSFWFPDERSRGLHSRQP